VPIPVVERSKAWVCGRSLAGIVGSKPTGGMLWVLCVVCCALCVVCCQVEVCVLWVLCVVR
jgi:hypothetical protein